MHVCSLIPDTSKVTSSGSNHRSILCFPDAGEAGFWRPCSKLIEQQRYDIEERQAERQRGCGSMRLRTCSLMMRALAESVAGGTYNWQELFDGQLMPAIKKLEQSQSRLRDYAAHLH